MQALDRLVDEAVYALIESMHPNPVGDGGAPSGSEVNALRKIKAGYVALSSLGSTGMGGGMTGETGTMKRLLYTVTGVGIEARQAKAVRDVAIGIAVDKDAADGDYLYGLTVPGFRISTRSWVRNHPTIKEGPTFNAPGDFEVVVSIA